MHELEGEQQVEVTRKTAGVGGGEEGPTRAWIIYFDTDIMFSYTTPL